MFKKLGSKRSIAVVSADIEWCPYHPENILLSNEPDRDLLLVEFIGNVDSKQFFDKYGKFMDEHGRLTDTYGYDPSKNCGYGWCWNIKGRWGERKGNESMSQNLRGLIYDSPFVPDSYDLSVPKTCLSFGHKTRLTNGREAYKLGGGKCHGGPFTPLDYFFAYHDTIKSLEYAERTPMSAGDKVPMIRGLTRDLARYKRKLR